MVIQMETKGMFRELAGHGFQIGLKNGYTISVIFGHGTYSTNRDICPQSNFRHMERREATTAEIAVMKPNGEFVKFGNDLCKGWQSVEDFIRIVKRFEKK
jgi:hypothetical protein